MSRNKPDATIEPGTKSHEGVPIGGSPGHSITFPYDVEFVEGHPFTVAPDQRIFLARIPYTIEAWETLERQDRGRRDEDATGPYRAFLYDRVGEQPGRPQFIVRP